MPSPAMKATPIVISFLTIASPLAGQGLTAQVSGSVHDPSGRLVVEARVVLQNSLTSLIREARTSEAGTFIFTEVLPGRFSLFVEAQGFKRFEQEGLDVSASERLALIPIGLEVGESKETVR